VSVTPGVCNRCARVIFTAAAARVLIIISSAAMVCLRFALLALACCATAVSSKMTEQDLLSRSLQTAEAAAEPSAAPTASPTAAPTQGGCNDDTFSITGTELGKRFLFALGFVSKALV
jgi:hypothetical protein